MISSEKPDPTVLLLEVNSMVNGPAVEVMEGITPTDGFPAQRRFPPKPAPLYIRIKSQQLSPSENPFTRTIFPGLLG